VKIVFAAAAWEDYQHWRQADPALCEKIGTLIRECTRTPFKGTGKPEPLRGDLQGWWSRRITREHRMVYRVTGSGAAQALEIAQLRYHY